MLYLITKQRWNLPREMQKGATAGILQWMTDEGPPSLCEADSSVVYLSLLNRFSSL
jgi:hypothetical protein